METFFGRLKNEMFYGYEKEYTSFEVFSKAIADYIDYYNNRRIQAKAKWMPPVKFREASMMKNELFSSTGAVQIIGYISERHWRRFLLVMYPVLAGQNVGTLFLPDSKKSAR